MVSSSASSSASQGEQISAAAYALPPLTPGGVGPAIEGLAIFYAIITIIVVSLRVWVRSGFSHASTRAWGPDDYLVVIATLLFIPAVVFAVLAAQYGLGSNDSELPSLYYPIRAAEYQVYWELLYFIASTIIKCAIGFTCIRLDRRSRILYPVSVNIAIMVIVTVLAVLYVFLNCRPFAATWNPYLGTCQKLISLSTVSYIVSAVQMCTDWACAIIPFFIVAGLQMSFRKKVSVMMILSLGILASILTVVRLFYLKYYDTTTYPTQSMYHFGIINILSTTECAIGIIGSSLAPLRKLFTFYYGSTNDKYSSGTNSNFLNRSNRGIQLSSMPASYGDHSATAGRGTALSGGNELDQFVFTDDSSRKGIVRKTEVFITST